MLILTTSLLRRKEQEVEVSIIIAFLSGGAATALINVLYKVWEHKHTEEDKDYLSIKEDLLLLKKANQAMIRSELRKRYNIAIAAGYVSFEDKQDFEFLYSQYHSLGSNGVMDECYRDLMELPLCPKNAS